MHTSLENPTAVIDFAINYPPTLSEDWISVLNRDSESMFDRKKILIHYLFFSIVLLDFLEKQKTQTKTLDGF